MRKVLSFLFLVTLCAAPAAKADDVCATASNLLTNCGFETGDTTGWSGAITTDGSTIVDGSAPYSGNQALSTGPFTNEALSQGVSTVAGKYYTVSFAATELFGIPDPTKGYVNDLTATFSGATLLSLTNVTSTAFSSNPYTFYTFVVEATGSSSNLNFTMADADGFWYVDSATVAQVTPEPSSLILLGTGAMGLVGAARRRFKR